MTHNKRIKELNRAIARLQTEKTKTTAREKAARGKWTNKYRKFRTASRDLAQIKLHGTVKEKNLQTTILGWDDLNETLTHERDVHRAKLAEIDQELTRLGLELAQLTAQQNGEVSAVDDIITQLFGLNDTVVRAAADREDCLKRHVFPRLFSEDGKLLSQVTFTSSNGLRRVIAMVNTMTIVEGDLADKAKSKIEEFFQKFQTDKMDMVTEAMFELTKQILIEKTKFKVGPHLYQFLGMELNEKIFPELALAQKYLRQSIRCEKTNSYIRIYERKSSKDNWEVVPQS